MPFRQYFFPTGRYIRPETADTIGITQDRICDTGLSKMSVDDRLDWEIENLRQSIERLWSDLASQTLTAEQRKAATENLSICVMTLRDLLDRQKQLSNKIN